MIAFRSLARIVIGLGVLAALVFGCTGPSPSPGTSRGLSIGAPQDGQTVAGTIAVVAGGIGGMATDLEFTLGDTTAAARSDGTATIDTRGIPDGTYDLTASATIDGTPVDDAITITVRNDLPASGTVGANGGTLRSPAGSYATLPAGTLDGSTSIELTDTTQEQILADHGIDYPALGVTFLGSLTASATGLDGTRSNTPIQVDLAGWASAVQPGHDVVMFTIAPDGDGDGMDELTFASLAEATPDGSVITRPTPRAEIYGFSGTGAGLRTHQSGTASPGTILELQARGLTSTSTLGNTARFDDGSEVVVSVVDIEAGAFNPLQTVRLAVPALNAGSATTTLHNATTGFETSPLDLEIGSLGAGNASTWTSFVEQVETAATNVTSGRDNLRAFALGRIAGLEGDATAYAMVANSGLVSAANLALLTGIDAGRYDDDQRDLVTRHALLLDALAISTGGVGGLGADLANLLLVAQPTSASPTARLAPQQTSGGSCTSAPSTPIVWGAPTGMGSAPPGGCAAGGSAGPSGGSTLMTQRLGTAFGPVEGALVRALVPGTGTRLSPFTAVTDAAGHYQIRFLPPGEPVTFQAIDRITGDIATATTVTPEALDRIVVPLAFEPAPTGPGTPIASFTYTDLGDGTFSFDATASYDPDGELYEYVWDFGDGTAYSAWTTEEHEYLYAGEFTVTLTVFDDQANAATASATLPELPIVFPIELVREGATQPFLDTSGDLVGTAPSFSTGGMVVTDMTTGDVTRVDVTADGTGGNDWSWDASMSGDGRYVAFGTRATNLREAHATVFVKDLVTGELDGFGLGETGDQFCPVLPAISRDGTHLAFVGEQGCGTRRAVFLFDLETRMLSRVDQTPEGVPDTADSFEVAVSEDGSVVAFTSRDTTLVDGDDNGFVDLFVYDASTATIDRASLTHDGQQPDAPVWPQGLRFGLTDDGRSLAFDTSAGNMVPNDTNSEDDVFVRDLVGGVLERVSVRADGSELADEYSESGRISGDGRYVAFFAAGDLTGDGADRTTGFYVKDLASGAVAWISRTNLGKDMGIWQSDELAISGNGRYIAFTNNRPMVGPIDVNDLQVYRVENPLWEAATP